MTQVVDPNYSEVVANGKTTIVASRPIKLTQQQVPKDMDLEVLGDEVTICGRIAAPGKKMTIFTRALILESRPDGAGQQPAELNVDGADGAPPEAALNAPRDGDTGSTGYNDCVQPLPAAGCTSKGGGNGQTANDTEWEWVQGNPDPQWKAFQWVPENKWMHGADGDPGKPGGRGGTIVVFCETFTPDTERLILSAKGGHGANGQNGQGGAKGGDGGPGVDAVGNTGTAGMGYKNATSGGNGGMGGNGGRGGDGGNGGDGGRIIFRAANPKGITGERISANADRGLRGEPGAGGKAGLGGIRGRGGAGAMHMLAWMSGSYDGIDGVNGRHGNIPGAQGHHGADGYVERTFDAAYKDLKSVLRNAFK